MLLKSACFGGFSNAISLPPVCSTSLLTCPDSPLRYLIVPFFLYPFRHLSLPPQFTYLFEDVYKMNYYKSGYNNEKRETYEISRIGKYIIIHLFYEILCNYLKNKIKLYIITCEDIQDVLLGENNKSQNNTRFLTIKKIGKKNTNLLRMTILLNVLE